MLTAGDRVVVAATRHGLGELMRARRGGTVRRSGADAAGRHDVAVPADPPAVPSAVPLAVGRRHDGRAVTGAR
ncbi:hypothetical protein NKH77_36685 [Streptomyces sp. M19]